MTFTVRTHDSLGWVQSVLFLLIVSKGSRSTGVFCLSPLATDTQRSIRTLHWAKRNKKTSRLDQDDLDRWYDKVDENASPDDVFWQEMERQRLLNQLPVADQSEGGRFSGSATTMYTASLTNGRGSDDSWDRTSWVSSGKSVGSIALRLQGSLMDNSNNGANNGEAMEITMDKKSAEATLQEFGAFTVKDNWLDENLKALMSGDSFLEDFSDDAKSLDEQLLDWENEDDSLSGAWSQEDEPWDSWGEEKEEEEDGEDDVFKLKLDVDDKNSEFLLKDDADKEDQLDVEREEARFQERVKGIKITSRRLENARKNPKAAAYFQSLEPNEIEGYDQMWVSAIENACVNNLVGTFRNYGVQFADNFGDWEDGKLSDCLLYTIEDIASYKARQVFQVTGLPCIASRTSFEIEPVFVGAPRSRVSGYGSRPNENPRVLTGYCFNDVGAHVDYMVEALKLFSEPTRVTEFRTCLCYYDGEMELFDYGVCECDLHFANSMRAFIPMAQAINEMMKKLQLTFGLEYQKWLRQRVDDTTGSYGGASLKLRDRVLKQGKVLPNDIIDVSAFMDSKVDVNLMDDCAQELAKRFVDLRPTKILTVATTGLVIALPMAKYLQVPVVYARKERNIVMADTFKAGYSSKTVGKNRELLVSTDHIDEGERILIVDDFLSSGSSQEALLRIVAEAGAEAVGVGVLLEKVYDSGRQSLSGFGIKVHSLCRVASVKGGVIQLVEEDGFDKM